LIASSVTNPEFITNGTQVDLYTTAVAVPSTVLLAADRLAIRVYVIHSSKTITLHTENSNLCQVITTFSTGINALNGLTEQVQNLAVGTSGTDFAISSATDTHTFNLPTASASNRGALSSADWTTFNGKQAAFVIRSEYSPLNAASIDIPIPVGYSYHKIKIVDVVATTGGSELWVRIGTGAPSVIQSGASDYSHYRSNFGTGQVFVTGGSAADSKIIIVGGVMPTGASGRVFDGEINLFSPDNTSYNKLFKGSYVLKTSGGNLNGGEVHSSYNANTAITSVRLLCSTGNISGKIVIESYL
jgi:hypothetical protein